MNAETLCGKVLGSCTLQKVIGHGSMGAVYLAHQSRPNRQVAVKVLLPTAPIQSSRHTAFLERFRHETDAAALLQHPNIMPVHEYGEIDGLAYLVMPYISGGTLQDELNTQGRLPLTRVVFYLEQIAAAIDFAHEHGVIHCDIKPANIMLTPEKRILLADFGLVKVMSGTPNIADIPVGTNAYTAPEHLAGGPANTYTDTYSLGMMLYQMVTGTLPSTNTSTQQTSPCLLRPDLPEAAAHVILRAIALQPTARYTHARDMAHEFRSQLEQAGVQVGTTYPRLTSQKEHTSSNRPRTRSLFDPLWRSDTSSVTAITTTGASEAIENKLPLSRGHMPDATATATAPSPKGKSTDTVVQHQENADSFIDTAGHVNASVPIHTDKQAAPTVLSPFAQKQSAKERNRLSGKDMNNQSRPMYQDPSVQNQPTPTKKPTNNLLLPTHLRQNRKTSLHGWQSEKLSAISPQNPNNPMSPPPATPNLVEPNFFQLSGDTPPSTVNPAPQESAPPPFLPKRASLNIGSRTRQLGASQSEEPTQEFNSSQFSTMSQPNGNITRQLTNTTGMLPAPGATGALMYPPGEYSGDTGMLRLNQPVKVVKVPVAGQPGQYMTGILPVQPRTNALPPLDGQNQNSAKKYSKIILLALLAFVLVVGGGGFLLLHQNTQHQTAINKNTTTQIQAHNATATAVANAQATAAINKII
jgi:eukaryotic-like serine/threonine-protein kinase